jgi:prepilin-type N-terminal cleavage/methylation domain-containing protein
MRRRTHGFTLIELLVVVAVIAILAAIAVPNFLEAQARSKVSRVKADFRASATALEAYRVDTNSYPYDYGTDEARSWAALTTPVAYLTSIATDVFLGANHYAFTGQRMAFAYLNPESIPGWGGPAQAYNLFYAVVSPGPNNRFEWADAAPAYSWVHVVNPVAAIGPAMLYDPTNGTVTAGDIVRTNVRMWN